MNNRYRHDTAAVRLGPVLGALFLCVLLAVSGIGYVSQKKKIEALGKDLVEREQKLGRLREYRQGLMRSYDYLSSPAALEKRIRGLELDLRAPTPEQVVTLEENAFVEQRAKKLTIRQSTRREAGDARLALNVR